MKNRIEAAKAAGRPDWLNLPEDAISASRWNGRPRWYFNGNPCKHGHIAPKMITSGRCIECAQLKCASEIVRGPINHGDCIDGQHRLTAVVQEPPAMPSMKVAVETITPAVASKMLENRPYQRRLRPATVELYVYQMQKGLWRDTGEAIKIDRDGNLCDGQHRLTAIVESGVTLNMLVVRDILPNAFDAMDQGAPRTPGDTLSRAGFRNAESVAAVCANLRRFDKETLTFTSKMSLPKLPREEIRQFADQRRERLDSAVYHAVNIKGVAGPSILGAFFYLVEYIDKEKATQFAEGLKTGASLDINSPILRVRNKLLEMRGMTRNGFDVVDLFPILAFGWNKHYRSEDATSVRVPNASRVTLEGAPMPGTVAWDQWV